LIFTKSLNTLPLEIEIIKDDDDTVDCRCLKVMEALMKKHVALDEEYQKSKGGGKIVEPKGFRRPTQWVSMPIQTYHNLFHPLKLHRSAKFSTLALLYGANKLE
jgi:hypothetical protein